MDYSDIFKYRRRNGTINHKRMRRLVVEFFTFSGDYNVRWCRYALLVTPNGHTPNWVSFRLEPTLFILLEHDMKVKLFPGEPSREVTELILYIQPDGTTQVEYIDREGMLKTETYQSDNIYINQSRVNVDGTEQFLYVEDF